MSKGKPTITVDNKEYELEILSGVVLDYKERSDTHVYGGGDVRNGNGSTYVSSSISISADLWFKQYGSGNELHGTYGFPLGVREGNIIHQVRLIGLGEELLIGVYNSSTQKFVEMPNNLPPRLKKLLYKKSGWKWWVFWLVILIGVGFIFALRVSADLMRDVAKDKFILEGFYLICGVGILAFIAAVIFDIIVNAGKERDFNRFKENMLDAIKKALPDAIKDIHIELAMAPIAAPANASIRTHLKNQPSSNSTFCVKCGTSIIRESKFCGGCGTGLATA